MTRIIALVAALMMVAPAAQAREQLERTVAADLREFNLTGVDVSSLETSQLAAISAIAHMDGPRGSKRAQIRSVLRGPDTLRGLFGWYKD
jgi:hypothetical protein